MTLRALYPLKISRPLFNGYRRGEFSIYGRGLVRPDGPGVNDRRARYARVVLNPDHPQTFLQTLAARHLASRGIIDLTEDYSHA